MAVDILLGLQWGDEGKGKVVDVFTPQYDIVARFQGGANAGHTLVINQKKHVLHLIPSGIFHTNTICLIGNGVVINPITLQEEVENLLPSCADVFERLYLAKRAHLIIPTHRLLDAASELAKGEKKIGSTLRGIGPTYMDKIGRNGLRVSDIFRDDFEQKYNELKQRHSTLLSNYEFEYDLAEDEKAFWASIEFLKRLHQVDSAYFINNALKDGKKVLAEGAQGTLLDVDFGSYPFVTSSNTCSAGACTGLGVAPSNIGRVFGIFKAYCTRVGSGPFPTELLGEVGEELRKAGSEFGATTGRPRRCGWLDLPLLRYTIMINGVTELIITKADVLSFMEEIQVCYAYEVNGQETQEVPPDPGAEFKPLFKRFPGWDEDVTGVRKREDLPQNLHTYLSYLETELGVPISFTSLGPGREQILKMQ